MIVAFVVVNAIRIFEYVPVPVKVGKIDARQTHIQMPGGSVKETIANTVPVEAFVPEFDTDKYSPNWFVPGSDVFGKAL